MANLYVLLAVISVLIAQLIIHFNFNQSASYSALQDSFKLMGGGRNWWAWANTVRSWGTISIFAIALVTQALSLYRLFGWVNKLVWLYVVLLGGSLVSIAYFAILVLAYEFSYNNLYGPYSDTAKTATKQMAVEFGGFLAIVAAFLTVLGQNRKTWLWSLTNEPVSDEESDAGFPFTF